MRNPLADEVRKVELNVTRAWKLVAEAEKIARQAEKELIRARFKKSEN